MICVFERIMEPNDLKPGYENVFTVTDYYDGPRRGVANFQGKPHFYDCIFDESKDDYTDFFWLTPIDSGTFELAMEDWAIWQKWEEAFHTGKTTLATHPALPEDADRSAELKIKLRKILLTDPKTAVTSAAKFEVRGQPNLSKGVMRPLQVKWLQPEGR